MPEVKTQAARDSLRSLAAGIHQANTLALRAAVQATETAARGTTLFKDKTGETRGSIHGEVLGTKGFVEARGAARWLEDGTTPHLIEARNAGALRFVVNGVTLYRRSVHHPGTRPRPFMQAAARIGAQALEYGVDYFFNYAIARA